MTSDKHKLGSFFTPFDLAFAICLMIDRDLGGPAGWVLEPSVGEGAFARAARAIWPSCRILGIDIDPEAPGFRFCDEAVVADFLTWSPNREFDAVVGNPPFSIEVERVVGKRNPKTKTVKQEVGEAHVRKAISLLTGGGSCSLLLRAAFLHPGRRTDLLEALDIEARVAPRPSFTGGKSDNSEYSVFQWRNSPFAPRRRSERLTWAKPRKVRAAKAAE